MKNNLKAAALAAAITAAPACGDDNDCRMVPTESDATYLYTPEAVQAYCNLDEVKGGIQSDLLSCIDMSRDETEMIQFRCNQLNTHLGYAIEDGHVDCVSGQGYPTGSCD